LDACRRWSAQRWTYDLLGNLINRATHLCLTGPRTGALTVRKCGHNLATQVWALPNGMGRHQRLL